MVAGAETRRSTTLSQLKEWLTLIGAVVVVLGGMLGGVRLVVAPLYTEMQAMNGRMDRMEAEIRAGREETKALRQDMESEFKAVREEFKAVRGEIAALREDGAARSERLARVETLIDPSGSRSRGEAPGFNDVVTAGFSQLPLNASVPSPYQTAGMTFFVHGPTPSPLPAIVDTADEQGYGFPDAGVTVALPIQARSIEVRVCLFASEILIETLNSAGVQLSKTPVQPGNECGDFSLAGHRISMVRFTGGGNAASIVRLSARSVP